MRDRAPVGTRLLKNDLDWNALTDDEVVALREKVNRTRSSRLARLATGFPDRRSGITESVVELPGRHLAVRVHRPTTPSTRLPLVMSFHGGGFLMGTAAQNDWLNSRLAAAVPAVVVAVEYRLAPENPLPAPVDDGHEALLRIVGDSARWGADPTSVAVLGESAGGTIAALMADRSRGTGPIGAQVLTCPVTDWTDSMTEHPSVVANAGQPGFSAPELRAARRLSIPAGMDARTVSPALAPDLTGMPPTLAVTGELDGAADHARLYVQRLLAAGSEAHLREHPRAVHAFLSMPGLVPAARPAAREITAFLRRHLRTGPGAKGGVQ